MGWWMRYTVRNGSRIGAACRAAARAIKARSFTVHQAFNATMDATDLDETGPDDNTTPAAGALAAWYMRGQAGAPEHLAGPNGRATPPANFLLRVPSGLPHAGIGETHADKPKRQQRKHRRLGDRDRGGSERKHADHT